MSRPEGLALSSSARDVLCVDSADCAPPAAQRFRCFNPFRFDPDLALPVPGQARTACSLESVWQGLKLVDGQTDLAMFDAPPYKRPTDQQRRADPGYDYRRSVFVHGDEIVDLITARYLIYLPAYLYLLEHRTPAPVTDEITSHLARGGEVAFFDWDDNFDIEDPGASFSHSALLAAWFAGTLEHVLERARQHLRTGRPQHPLPPSLAALPSRYQALHGRQGPSDHVSGAP